MTQKDRYKHILNWFQANVPEAKSELDYNDPYQLLVAVILSAQCTDKRVNATTPAFFNRFPNPASLASSDTQTIYEHIRSISYPNNKAKSLLGMAQMLVNAFNSRVPETMEELLQLPGVGRKTASVILIVAFNKPAMPVDTHVFRVANRLGLTEDSKSPEETERILLKNIPQHLLPIAHHWLILHGRYICKARKPDCAACGLITWCKLRS